MGAASDVDSTASRVDCRGSVAAQLFHRAWVAAEYFSNRVCRDATHNRPGGSSSGTDPVPRGTIIVEFRSSAEGLVEAGAGEIHWRSICLSGSRACHISVVESYSGSRRACFSGSGAGGRQPSDHTPFHDASVDAAARRAGSTADDCGGLTARILSSADVSAQVSSTATLQLGVAGEFPAAPTAITPSCRAASAGPVSLANEPAQSRPRRVFRTPRARNGPSGLGIAA